MTQYSPVGPLHLLEQLAEGIPSTFGGYHLILAQDVLAAPQEHERFWAQWRAACRDRFPVTYILDNGAPEGEQVTSSAQLLRAARLIGADVVVMPDVIGDRDETLLRTSGAMHYFRQHGQEFELMGVAQGSTWSETVDCLHQLGHLDLDWLSVPKGWSERLLQPRFWLTRQAARTYQRKMHVLGFTDDLSDDVLSARSHWLVQGIDSAMPLWLGQQGVMLTTMERKDYGRRPRWQDLPSRLTAETVANISLVRTWLSRSLEDVGQEGPPTASRPRSAAAEPGLAAVPEAPALLLPDA